MSYISCLKHHFIQISKKIEFLGFFFLFVVPNLSQNFLKENEKKTKNGQRGTSDQFNQSLTVHA